MFVWSGKRIIYRLLTITLVMALLAPVLTYSTANLSQGEAYIVQSSDLDTAAAAVEAIGGRVTHELGVIDAVGSTLTTGQLAQLRAKPDLVRLYVDQNAHVASEAPF